MARDFQNDDEPPTGAEAALETRVAAFEDCGTLTAASASTGVINLLGGKMRRVRAVCLPASEGVGPRVRIRLAPAASRVRTRPRFNAFQRHQHRTRARRSLTLTWPG